MQNISKEFTYNIADDQYYQTAELKKTGTITYEGPEKQYLIINSTTNKLTGAIIAEEQYETFNETNDEFYVVEVDCNTNPLICSLVGMGINEDLYPNISEDILGSNIPYVRDDPVMPDHTYEVKEITYDIAGQQFITPFAWKKPFVTWKDKITYRNTSLAAYDNKLSEDLPTAIYNKVAEYKQYLRDFPVTFGAAWDITVTAGGTGYVVGDRILISDPVYKNNTAASDIIVKVETVDNVTGEILTISRQSSVHAYAYHPAAGSYVDVYHTTNSATGAGSKFKLSKVKTVDPWKITPPEPPLG